VGESVFISRTAGPLITQSLPPGKAARQQTLSERNQSAERFFLGVFFFFFWGVFFPGFFFFFWGGVFFFFFFFFFDGDIAGLGRGRWACLFARNFGPPGQKNSDSPFHRRAGWALFAGRRHAWPGCDAVRLRF